MKDRTGGPDYFLQARGPDHEGIPLVPAESSDQGAGRFYHVKGDVGMCMTYGKLPGYRFSASKSVLQELDLAISAAKDTARSF
ncbi:hypothetical protein AJ78_08144 [Emergomyces pasteurianus Ep9510]|uniref:Uncharacterized protein n=1 Tax=Emergomyces pasteurianus Ep9510 TaxID=1447872 RepID=A0A1J9Q761_9EURO|nr:hypothetical protein AJ78_08144 [Emergomyces pasteurianus Ep9510]